MNAREPVVAVVGATGAVGVEIVRCLEQRKFPLSKLRLLASARSAGKTMTFRGETLTVEELTEQSFDGRSEEHTSELQSRENLVCRLLLEKKNQQTTN